MANSEDFIQKFHSLEGITLREKKKSFYILLTSSSHLASDTLDDIIRTLKPSTFLEERYKLELLIYNKRTHELIETLIRGEEIGSQKIIRQDWFIEKLMSIFTPHQFVEQLVPQLSFSIRTKLFKKILVFMKDVNLIEELFDKVLMYYGVSSALVFLSGCSKNKIEEIFTKFDVKFSSSQLKSLFQKDKDIIMLYFHVLIEIGYDVDNYKWNSFFLYMGRQDPVFYLNFCDKFNIHKLKLGKKSTKKYVDIEREKIVQKPFDYYRFLRKDALVRKLGADFPIFFKNSLPENLEQFHFNYKRSLIKYYPRKKQYDLYLNTFEEVYKKSLWDCVQYMDENLIELITDKDVRENWVAKYENRKNIKKYMLKKRKYAMFFSEDKEENVIKDKKTIFNTLISSCKLMNDYSAFKNILKSFCERHRNSDVTIIYNFLRTVHKELNLSMFQDEHWEYIYYIISIQLFKKQQIFHPIYVEYIKHLYCNNKPIDEHVLTLLNEAPLTLSKFNYDNKNFQKALHLLFLKFLPEVKNRRDDVAIEIALSIMKWNAKYPSETISFSEENDILNAVKQLGTTDKINKKTMKVFKYLICNQKITQMSLDLDNIYWSSYGKIRDNSVTNWFVKYKPLVLKENLNKIGFMLKDGNRNLVCNLKKYTHLEIPSSIVKLCLEDLKIAEPSRCCGIIRILVLFMESNDLYSYMQQYVPQVDRVDSDNLDENTQKSYAIQQALGRYSKSCTNVKMLLPILLNYCKGDVLNSSLSSLYSSFHRIPENALYSPLEQLKNKPVSVRKHTIFLTCLILPLEKVFSKYEEILSSEKNSSVKEHMFKSCYKFFIKNTQPECWLFLKTYLKQLRKDQKDVLKMITNIRVFPISYRPEYVEIVWNILEKFKKEGENLDDNMSALINNLTTKDITRLNSEFCYSIIENKLFNTEKCSMDDEVFAFARNFYLYGTNSTRKADALCKKLFQMRKLSNDAEKKIESLCMLHKVCFKIGEDILKVETENFDKLFSKQLKDALIISFPIEEIFEEILLLRLIELKIDSDKSENLFAIKMSKFFMSVAEKYGNLLLKPLNHSLRVVLDILFANDDFGLLNFLNCFLLDGKSSIAHYVSAIDLLPHVTCVNTDMRTKNAFEQLLKKLEERDSIIKICFYGKLKDI